MCWVITRRENRKNIANCFHEREPNCTKKTTWPSTSPEVLRYNNLSFSIWSREANMTHANIDFVSPFRRETYEFPKVMWGFVSLCLVITLRGFSLSHQRAVYYGRLQTHSLNFRTDQFQTKGNDAIQLSKLSPHPRRRNLNGANTIIIMSQQKLHTHHFEYFIWWGNNSSE